MCVVYSSQNGGVVETIGTDLDSFLALPPKEVAAYNKQGSPRTMTET